MSIPAILNRTLTAGIVVALLAGVSGASAATERRVAKVGHLPPNTQRPTRDVLLSIGQGELINLPVAVSDIWVSNPGVADVYVDNARRIHLFGKAFGEATVFATSAGGTVVYSANVRVSQNITSIDEMMKAAMPDADIRIVSVGQIAVLTGTVASPQDSAQAQQLVASLLNPGVDVTAANAQLKVAVINRLKMATPLQVNLQVRIAEVSRSFAKNIGNSLQSYDNSSGFKFGLAQGTQSTQYTPGGNLFVGGTTTATASAGTTIVSPGANGTTLGLAGKFLGLNLLSAIQLGETDGQVSMLAQPNLSALSGETATFLVGGEIPIPIAQPGSGGTGITIEYKQYGISLAYTPTVLSDGRISLRVRPEVSQLSSAGAVILNGTSIPALSTRRAETTLEMGSGESMVIGGLISNDNSNSIDKAPGLGDLPILGAAFRSNAFKRNETELMIVITPYLVKPIQNPADVVLPTDGSRAPTDLGRVFMGDLGGGVSGARRPVPTMAAGAPVTAIGASAPVAPAPQPRPVMPVSPSDARATAPKKGQTAPMPGFSQ